jgi:ketosteroid isomerase-like protein
MLTRLSVAATAAGGQGLDGVEPAVQGFLAAFNDLDMPRFLTYFAEDASIFHPPSAPPRTFPARLQGKKEIERTFQVVFDQIRTLSGRTSAPFQTIQPQDSVIQRFDGVAIVTFHLGNEKVRGRRTLVLRQIESEWKIAHLHASTFTVDQP